MICAVRTNPSKSSSLSSEGLENKSIIEQSAAADTQR